MHKSTLFSLLHYRLIDESVVSYDTKNITSTALSDFQCDSQQLNYKIVQCWSHASCVSSIVRLQQGQSALCGYIASLTSPAYCTDLQL